MLRSSPSYDAQIDKIPDDSDRGIWVRTCEVSTCYDERKTRHTHQNMCTVSICSLMNLHTLSVVDLRSNLPTLESTAFWSSFPIPASSISALNAMNSDARRVSTTCRLSSIHISVSSLKSKLRWKSSHRCLLEAINRKKIYQPSQFLGDRFYAQVSFPTFDLSFAFHILKE